MKIKRIAANIVAVLGFFAASQALANGSATGKVVNIQVVTSGGPHQQGVAFIYLESKPSGSPECGKLPRWAVDLGVNSGQAAYSLALAAQLSGKTVTITGQGSCDVWSDTETALYISEY